MVSIETFREMALAFSGATEQPHFEKTSFRLKNIIFATYDLANNRACVKLSATDKDAYSKIDATIIYPVPNKWGRQGWTLVEMKKVKKQIFKEILLKAYLLVAPKHLHK